MNILHQQGTFAVVVPQKRGLWVSAKFVDHEKSCVTADSVRVRMLPTTNGRIVARLSRGHKVEILPAEAGDPVDWVRLKHAAYGLEDRCVLVEMKNLKDLTYGDGDFALDTRIEDVAWVINGKRTLARRTDVELLKTFLSGKLNLPELYETIFAALLAGADPVLRRTKRYGHFGTEMPLCLIDPKKYEYLNVTTGCSAATDFFTVGPNGRLRVCNHSPVELVRWNDWDRLPDCEEWMHYVRHDYLPEACAGCAVASRCLGGCREAARVFRGSPRTPDPVCETVRPLTKEKGEL